MSGVSENSSTYDMFESKIDTLLRAVEALLMRTGEIESFIVRINNDRGSHLSQPLPVEELLETPTIALTYRVNTSVHGSHQESLKIK